MPYKGSIAVLFAILFFIVILPAVATPGSETSTTATTPSSTPAAAAPAPAPTVTISGVVYEAATVNTMDRASVTVSSGGFTRTATTGAGGRYSISGCPSGKTLAISGAKAGYRQYTGVVPSGSTTHDIYLRPMLKPIDYGAETPDAEGPVDGVTPPASSDTEYVPGVDPSEFEEREPEDTEEPEDIPGVEKIEQAIIAAIEPSDERYDIEIASFTVDAIPIRETPVLFAENEEGERFMVRWTVRNNGPESADNIVGTMHLYRGDRFGDHIFLREFIVGTLGPDDPPREYGEKIFLEPGVYSLYVWAGVPDIVTNEQFGFVQRGDIDSTNNNDGGHVVVREGERPNADLKVAQFRIDGEDVTDGMTLPRGNQPRLFQLWCKNDGPDSVPDSEIECIFDRHDDHKVRGGGLDKDEAPFTQFMRALGNGRHEIKAEISSKTQHNDPNWMDNKVEAVVTVDFDRTERGSGSSSWDWNPFSGEGTLTEIPQIDAYDIDVRVRAFMIDGNHIPHWGDAVERPYRGGWHNIVIVVDNAGSYTTLKPVFTEFSYRTIDRSRRGVVNPPLIPSLKPGESATLRFRHLFTEPGLYEVVAHSFQIETGSRSARYADRDYANNLIVGKVAFLRSPIRRVDAGVRPVNPEDLPEVPQPDDEQLPAGEGGQEQDGAGMGDADPGAGQLPEMGPIPGRLPDDIPGRDRFPVPDDRFPRPQPGDGADDAEADDEADGEDDEAGGDDRDAGDGGRDDAAPGPDDGLGRQNDPEPEDIPLPFWEAEIPEGADAGGDQGPGILPRRFGDLIPDRELPDGAIQRPEPWHVKLADLLKRITKKKKTPPLPVMPGEEPGPEAPQWYLPAVLCGLAIGGLLLLFVIWKRRKKKK